MLKKGDAIIIAVIVALAVFGFILSITASYGAGDRIAVIKQENRIIKRINLDKVQSTQRIDVSSKYRVMVLVEKGRIRFEEADCPDKLCVKAGWLDKKGDKAACLPNLTMIKIEGQPDNVDGGTF